MNTFGKTLKDRCRVAGAQNRFVGIKADTESAEMYFPIGRHLSDDERILCEDIITSLRILYAFMKRDELISARGFDATQNVEFPIHAYLKIITRFLNDGRYYIESEPDYKVGANGQISWARTLRTQKGFVKNGS